MNHLPICQCLGTILGLLGRLTECLSSCPWIEPLSRRVWSSQAENVQWCCMVINYVHVQQLYIQQWLTHLMLQKTKSLWLINQSIESRNLRSVFLESSKHSIPNDENSSIVFIQAVPVWPCKNEEVQVATFNELVSVISGYHDELYDVVRCLKCIQEVQDVPPALCESKIDTISWTGHEPSW